MDNHRIIEPPKLATRFLSWFLRDDLLEEVQGDLDEKFHNDLQTRSAFRSKLNYWYQVIHYLRPFAIRKLRSNSTYINMYQHNITLSYRNFRRYKASFLINLTGLSVGLACAILIFVWISHEHSIDHFHEKDQQLYQVFLNHEESDGINTNPATQGILADALEAEIPEVRMAVEDTGAEWFANTFTISDGKDFYRADGKFAGPGYFDLFSYPIIAGQRSTPLSDKSSIVISKSLAENMFGSTDVIGNTVNWSLLQFEGTARISAVLDDLPANASEEFEFVLPFDIYKDIIGEGMHWGNYNAYTYVELAAGTDVAALNDGIVNYIKEKDEWSNVSPFFYPFSRKHLYGQFENGREISGGRIETVRLFGIIGIFLLVIASINFMNLTTARASRRMKEIGVKKALGAIRGQLVSQYLTEAILISFMAGILAVLLATLFMPQFSLLTGKSLSIDWSMEFVGIILGITFLTGLMAGSYPALYLSGFKPIEVLKGKLHSSTGEVFTRKGLVVFQFVISIVMIVFVAVVYRQIEFVQSQNLGYDRYNLLKVPLEGNSSRNLESLIFGLSGIPGVENASATTHHFVQGGSWTTGIEWEAKDPDSNVKFEQARAYYNLIETMGIEVVEGRSFSRDFHDEKSKIIFNETAIQTMGMEDPIGKKVVMWGEPKEIIGVVKDFNFASLHTPVTPMLFHFDTTFMQFAMVRLNAQRIPESIEAIDEFYSDYNPGYTLDYEFLDQNYQRQYLAEQRVSVLSRYFAGIAILISCLGLFGLAAYTAERRQKELGIRRILGAGDGTIIRLLSGDFTRMIIIAIVIALPISYYFARQWLSDFAYVITLEWWFFAGAGLLALLISWITISFQAFKTVHINPVDCLKED